MPEKRLTSKELAWELMRSPAYVCLMRRAGFVMPGGMATHTEACEWLALNDWFTCGVARRKFPPLRARRAVNSVNSSVFRGV